MFIPVWVFVIVLGLGLIGAARLAGQHQTIRAMKFCYFEAWASLSDDERAYFRYRHNRVFKDQGVGALDSEWTYYPAELNHHIAVRSPWPR